MSERPEVEAEMVDTSDGRFARLRVNRHAVVLDEKTARKIVARLGALLKHFNTPTPTKETPSHE